MASFSNEMVDSEHPTAGGDPHPTARRLYWNFLTMAVCFSVNHGCVTGVLVQSTVVLGSYGSYASGTLYICYALTALLFATSSVKVLGTRRALISAMGLYCLYVASFPVALWLKVDNPAFGDAPVCNVTQPEKIVGTASKITAIGGAVVGGYAAGFLWTAQGAYYTQNAKLYAARQDVPLGEATASFASVFAFCYLSAEVLLKLLATALAKVANVGTNLVFAIYLMAAIASILPMLWFVMDLDRTGTKEEETKLREADGGSTNDGAAAGAKPAGGTKFLAAVSLWWKDPRILLLAPTQMAFGFSAALLGYYVSGNAVPHWRAIVGKSDAVGIVGFLSAFTAVVAAVLQWPFKLLSGDMGLGKAPFMLLGSAAFAVLAVICMVDDEDAISAWGWMIALYGLQGIGRASFEGTNRATHADFFPDDSPAAFSNMILWNGLASTLAFFIFPTLKETGENCPTIGDHGRRVMSITGLTFAVTAMVCYAAAVTCCQKRAAKSSDYRDFERRSSQDVVA